jgi:methionyl-tRNA formyltransferase
MRTGPSAVKGFASGHGIEVFQPENFKSEAIVERIRTAGPDALVVAAYGLILPRPLLEAGPYGALNIHASLLPRWRGAAPIQRALLAGDAETGISIMQMDAGLDTGPVLSQRALAIHAEDDAGSLHQRLAELGATMILETLTAIEHGGARAVPQPQTGATYARKIEKHEALLNWSRPAVELERAVRAFRPAPGAWSKLGAEPMKIWRARVVPDRLAPGKLTQDLVVGCGEGALAIDELQLAGGKRLPAAQFLRGHALPPDARLG